MLCLHAVSHSWPAELSTTPHRLERMIELLLRRGYRGATFEDAVTRPPSRRTLCVTFDDAFSSVHQLAFPLLERLGVPATVFVPTDFAGASAPMSWPGIDRWLHGPYEGELEPMSWDGLDELSRAGWEIGSHTRSHPKLTQLSDTALADELQGSRQACEEQLSRPCRTIAYPYGDVDARVVAATAAAGYAAAAALPTRPCFGGPLLWPRVGVYHRDDLRRFRLKTSIGIRRLRSSPAGALVDRLVHRSAAPRLGPGEDA